MIGIAPYLIISVALAIHAMKTGRSQWWLFILLFVPYLGAIAYVVVELVPALFRSRGARKIGTGIETMIDPNKEWRERLRQAELVDSVDAKRALAEECERKGMWDEAIRLYNAAATGIFADDPAVLTGLARAQLGGGDAAGALATLDKLHGAQPEFRSQEAGLLFARALEATGQIETALQEYDAVSRHYAGFEARSRYALLLLKQGQIEQARDLFQEVVRASSARHVAITPADREWIRIAKANLR
ncbi:MAG TPA: tetratricopeptide repeat protein [Hyphomicrobiales bacterium]|nr:tetratricopeptide repeat protein [Hyphomicrobiales bacterium]